MPNDDNICKSNNLMVFEPLGDFWCPSNDSLRIYFSFVSIAKKKHIKKVTNKFRIRKPSTIMFRHTLYFFLFLKCCLKFFNRKQCNVNLKLFERHSFKVHRIIESGLNFVRTFNVHSSIFNKSKSIQF